MLFPDRIVGVLLPQPFPEPFDYLLPEGVEVSLGAFVSVPLGSKEVIGVVWSHKESSLHKKLKPIISVIDTAQPLNQTMRTFIERASKYACVPLGNMLAMTMRSREALDPSPTERMVVPTGKTPDRMTPAREKVIQAANDPANEPMTAADLARKADVSSGVVKGLVDSGTFQIQERDVDTPFAQPDPDRPTKILTEGQLAAAGTLSDLVRAQSYQAALLDGITGSGKTEVYFEAIAAALRDDPTAQVLVLLPEIALTQAVTSRFEERFGCAPAQWHSAAGAKARRRVWREVSSGRARIVAGARSALFLPFQNLRLIVIDEEHDTSYKQEEGAIYNARDLGVLRAHGEGCAIVLASATPSLETLWNAQQGRYTHLKLRARPGVARLPEIALADMRLTPPDTGRWLSPPLVDAMKETLEAGEQVLLYLNRRGYAPLVLCKACGERLKAPDTESWLTEHRYSGMLLCHLTGFTMRKPSHCPKCGAEDSLSGVGPGVERLAEETRVRFPGVKVEVFSSDTTSSPEALCALIDRMERGEIDVMIGTQMAAKGHNFPNLTLVGVVDADSSLKGGDLRAGERTYQILSQVAGRAGRAEKPGRAIIQTYAPESPAFELLAAGDRDGYMEFELSQREMMGYPPFGRLGAIILSAPTSEDADEWARAFGGAEPNAQGVDVLGPAPAPISVLRGRHRRRFLIRADRTIDLSAFMTAWKSRVKLPSNIRIALDVEPYNFM